jgi:hypothetical protein
MSEDDPFVTYEPPPKRFDPLKADQVELENYGYPPRPDPELQPRLWGLWEQSYGREHRFIRAELQENELMAERPNTLVDPPEDGRFKPGGWGGAVLQPASYNLSPPEKAVLAFGEWMVPSLAPDLANLTDQMTVGFWTGIDGYVLNNQVLQAGVAASVTGTTIGKPWPWVEWYPIPPKTINNFEVNAGDRVAVLVIAIRPDYGFASFYNKTTGLCTSAGIHSRTYTGIRLISQGQTAEWAVEGVSADLPNFGAVAFLHCLAGTPTHELDLSKASVTNIGGNSGAQLTNSSIVPTAAGVPPSSVIVIWEGFR